MISWKLKTKNNNIKNNNIVEAYICNCGHTEFIVKYSKQELKYTCEKCENTKFYDVNSVWNHIDNFLYENEDVILDFDYYIECFTDKVVANYGIELPYKIDYLNKKIIFANKSRFSITFTSNGDLEESSASAYYNQIFLKLHYDLTQYINKNSCFNIPDSKGKNFNLETASFFLKHKHLNDYDFSLWGNVESFVNKYISIDKALEYVSNYTTEEYIKKIVHLNYQNQLKYNGKYYSFFIEVFCKNISDVNILAKFLELDFYYTENNLVSKNDLNSLIVFLKIHYSEPQILNLFSQYDFNTDSALFSGMVKEYSCYTKAIKNMFNKVPCRVQELYNEFYKCKEKDNAIKGKHKLINMESQIQKSIKLHAKACVSIDIYQVKLPNNSTELYQWSEWVESNLAGFDDMYNGVKTNIYGFFQEETLIFTAEIKNKMIVEVSTIYDYPFNEKDSATLEKWFKLYIQ